MSSPSKRRQTDLMKLAMSDFDVSMGESDSSKDFYVKFHGPKDSPYEGGTWKVHVTLPAEYPYKSPSIGFCNTLFHPNVDERSGSVCLDVINQTWSPMFDLVNIFSVFLPQLLLYPNAADPLNEEAASLYNENRKTYEEMVRKYVKKHATGHIAMDEDSDEDSDEDPLSDMDEEELGMAADMEL